MGALALLRKLANLHQKARTSIRKNDSIQFRAYITREHSFHSLRNFTVSAIVPVFFFDRRFQFQLELNKPKDVVQRFALHGKISCPFPSPPPPPQFATRTAYWWLPSNLAWDGGNSHRVLHQPLQRCIRQYEGTLGMDMWSVRGCW